MLRIVPHEIDYRFSCCAELHRHLWRAQLGMINNKQIIQRLMVEAPRGQPLDAALLQAMGVDAGLTDILVRDGWLMKLAKNTFLMTGDAPTSEGTIAFLSRRIPGLHVAAKTALGWHGIRHNLYFHERIMLWGLTQAYIPDWVGKTQRFNYQKSTLFNGSMPWDKGLKPLPNKNQNVLVSIPERAVLEYASGLDIKYCLEDAQNLMIGMRNLRSNVLAEFIVHCKQKKAVAIVQKLGLEADFTWANEVKSLMNSGLMR